MTNQSTLQEMLQEMKHLIDRQISAVFTCEFVVIEEIDHENARVEISHKDDKDVMADEVPILSAYAGDGYGTIEPLEVGDEGIALFNMDPTTDLLTERGHVDIEKQRKHSVQDAMFFPRPWFDGDEVPDHEVGERLVYHESGTFFSIKPNGNTVIQHVDGNRMRLDPNEGVIETEDQTRQIGVREDGVEARVERPDGEEVLLRAQDNRVRITAPDVRADHVTDPQVEISVDENGVATLDGITEVGDTDAQRVDQTTENTDPDDPRTYEEVNEDVVPISRPSETTQTQYSNPDTVEAQGSVDMGMYELRRHVPERREEDPDPTVTDPTNPAYIELPDELRQLGEIPRGYSWINVTDGVYRMWGDSGAPVDIISGV